MPEADRTHTTTLVVGVMPGQADAVVQQAALFASRMDASLALATVDTTRYTTNRGSDGTITAFAIDPDAGDEITEEFDPLLAAHLRTALEATGIAWSLHALAGDPSQELARLADDLGALAIVVGTRKPGLRTSAHEFFNGSVAVHLAHRQHRPVIVIPVEPVGSGTRLPWEG